MSGGTIAAIVIGSVVVVGGGATAYFVLRRRPMARMPGGVGYQPDANQMMGSVQAAVGPRAASGKGLLMNPQLLGLAGNVLDKYYPGLGSTAKGAVQSLDKYVGTGLAKKIPGVSSIGSKLHLW